MQILLRITFVILRFSFDQIIRYQQIYDRESLTFMRRGWCKYLSIPHVSGLNKLCDKWMAINTPVYLFRC